MSERELGVLSLSETELAEHRERKRLGYYSEHAKECRANRDLSSTWEVNATLHIISPDRWLENWEEMLAMISKRFEENIESKIFDSYLWNASVADRGIDRDFDYDGHWTRGRRLSDLPTVGASASGVTLGN